MRVRIVVAVALTLAGVGVAVTLSRRVALSAGTDHIVPAVFAATLPAGGALCQVNPYLRPGAASAQLVIGSYGRPLPALRLRFTDAAGAVVSSGRLAAGAHEGTVSIPIGVPRDAGAATKVCLGVGSRGKVAVGGVIIGRDPTDETVNGAPQPGRFAVAYGYAGRPAPWWSQLRAVDQRFGLGKASFFGDWALPACVVLLLGAWGTAVRLLVREGR